MSTEGRMLDEIRQTPGGIAQRELLACYPDVTRRTAQCWIAALIAAREAGADGKAYARRYLGLVPAAGRGADTISAFTRPLFAAATSAA